MKKSPLKLTPYLLILFIGIASGIFLTQNETTWSFIKKPFIETYNKFDDTREIKWNNDFKIVDIESGTDHTIQKAYFFKTRSEEAKPLIVSLHSWSGDYTQNDSIAEFCKEKDLNYIHPDFRGPNWTKNACCSELVLNDIDEAISYAIKNANVDTNKIYVIGSSGGGYATLSTFMKSKHKIKKFSAWVPISDLVAWYNESKIIGNKYAGNILDCTESKNGLDIKKAEERSPIYWNTPAEKLAGSKLAIYDGIYDGIQGSVPITHSINFYNKILRDLSVSDSSKYVSNAEKLKLLEFRKPLGEFGSIGGRKVFLRKEFGNISLILFEGNHEMLYGFAFNDLIKDQQ